LFQKRKIMIRSGFSIRGIRVSQVEVDLKRAADEFRRKRPLAYMKTIRAWAHLISRFNTMPRAARLGFLTGAGFLAFGLAKRMLGHTGVPRIGEGYYEMDSEHRPYYGTDGSIESQNLRYETTDFGSKYKRGLKVSTKIMEKWMPGIKRIPEGVLRKLDLFEYPTSGSYEYITRSSIRQKVAQISMDRARYANNFKKDTHASWAMSKQLNNGLAPDSLVDLKAFTDASTSKERLSVNGVEKDNEGI